ncbi:MAG: hypothetical protein HY707_08800 [Ignavibacteriae bacterium]|nr:hypothetical protein [Ignavibacteriota bacterium]
MSHKPLFIVFLFVFVGCESTTITFTDIALVLATLGLVFATWKLAQYTRALSKLTERLVNIENKRDERDEKEKRLKDLASGLAAAEIVQRIYPESFAQRLNKPSDLPIEEMNAIEVLQSRKKYIGDTDSHPNLDYLCSVFDSVRREKSGVRQNEADIAKRIHTLQGRIQWFVDEARREIGSAEQ